MKRFIIDVYAEMDEEHVGQEIYLDSEYSEIRCLETGEVFTGTMVIKDLKVVRVESNEDKDL